MSSTNSSATRICPVCDARNSNLSLFCAECGASLNAPVDSDTAAFEPVRNTSDDAQETAAFEPATGNATLLNTPAAPVPPSPAFSSPWEPVPDAQDARNTIWTSPDMAPPAHVVEIRPRSMRGFFLGLLAVILIVAILLLWSWASILDQGARDSIRDAFDFIG